MAKWILTVKGRLRNIYCVLSYAGSGPPKLCEGITALPSKLGSGSPGKTALLVTSESSWG